MTTPQRIVKLVPYGNPEDMLFAEIVVGGTDELSALVDFIGWHIQLFSGLTTDGSGDVSVTLANTPTGLLSCFVLTSEPERVVRAKTLSGSPARTLLVEKRKLVYDKPATPTAGAANAPAGVTVGGASGALTTDTTLSGDAAAIGAGTGSALQAGLAHHHAFNTLYDHDHALTFASTSLALATGEATELAVLYR